ncbi:COP9 signalosome catalytic subunit rri1, partial [Pichia californica]
MNESKSCSCSYEEDTLSPITTKSFELIEYLNNLTSNNLSNIKKLSLNESIDINSPPEISSRILESDGNFNNEYYTFLNNENNENNGNNGNNNKIWKNNPYYFRTVNISLLTILKMSNHAISGGSIEIMGMLVGYYKGNEIIILDCYPLPVKGTESRVNPQNDSYEFMLSYITKLQESGLKRENIIGWYHSHPGFGCWLSGIDVQTQKLHQNFEDPYVAIVIDPIKCIKNGKIDIGAFRTLNNNDDKNNNNNNNNN